MVVMVMVTVVRPGHRLRRIGRWKVAVVPVVEALVVVRRAPRVVTATALVMTSRLDSRVAAEVREVAPPVVEGRRPQVRLAATVSPRRWSRQALDNRSKERRPRR